MKAQRKFVFLMVMAAALLAFAGVAAADEEYFAPYFTDGRVNAYDQAAPIVIYCEIDYPYSDDINMGVLGSIEGWAYSGTEGVFTKVLDVSADEIDTVEASEDGTTVIAVGGGFALYEESDGSLTVAGSGYSFNWTPGESLNC